VHSAILPPFLEHSCHVTPATAIGRPKVQAQAPYKNFTPYPVVSTNYTPKISHVFEHHRFNVTLNTLSDNAYGNYTSWPDTHKRILCIKILIVLHIL